MGRVCAMKYGRFSLFVMATILGVCGFARADGSTAVRHLVYNFEVSLATTSTVHSSGIGDGASSGSVDYHGSNADQGQITVDVTAVQPDTGLVVTVAETGRNSRNNAATMCVVYGNGAVICDQSKGGINEEEMSLLRVLGRDFVNHTLIDAKNHWQYAQSTPQGNETNDYTINSTNGDLLNISFERVLKVSGADSFDATSDGHIVYNQKLNVPSKIIEDTITRKNTGMGNYDKVDQQISLTLTHDSMGEQAAQGH